MIIPIGELYPFVMEFNIVISTNWEYDVTWNVRHFFFGISGEMNL